MNLYLMVMNTKREKKLFTLTHSRFCPRLTDMTTASKVETPTARTETRHLPFPVEQMTIRSYVDALENHPSILSLRQF